MMGLQRRVVELREGDKKLGGWLRANDFENPNDE